MPKVIDFPGSQGAEKGKHPAMYEAVEAVIMELQKKLEEAREQDAELRLVVVLAASGAIRSRNILVANANRIEDQLGLLELGKFLLQMDALAD